MNRAEAEIIKLQLEVEAIKVEVAGMHANDMFSAAHPEQGMCHCASQYAMKADEIRKCIAKISLYAMALPHR